MLLVVDVGNTQCTFGVFAGRQLNHSFRLASDRGRTEDEWAALIHQVLRLRALALGELTDTIVASVVPSVTQALRGALVQLVRQEPLIVGTPTCQTGLTVLYEAPGDVGADRLVNAVAAWERHRSGAMVVDFGTATTIDCVSPDGEYLGGVIVPGLRLGLEALLSRSEQLKAVPLAAPGAVLGKTTRHSLQSGVVHGHASLVDGLVDKLRRELAFECHVLATGGLAALVVPHLRTVTEVDADLTLQGLRIVYEHNRSPLAEAPP